MNSESEHFTICQSCGRQFDMRDLSQIAEHFHEKEMNINPESLRGISSHRVGDSVEWKDSKPTYLN